MSWWFGLADEDARQPVLHTVLRAQHELVGDKVRATAASIEEVTAFLDKNPQLKILGRCFSHHSRSSCRPTPAEVKMFFDLAKSDFPSEVILGVV